MKPIKRRDFIKAGVLAGGAVIIANQLKGSGIFNPSSGPYLTPEPGEMPDIVTISADNLEDNIKKLLEPLGGISNFVKPGQTVGLLANSPWKNAGYYTNPDVVLAVAGLCQQAGAKEIVCLHPAQQNYWERGKLYAEHQDIIDKFIFGSDRMEVDIPKGKTLKKAEIYKLLKEVDVFISIPVAKHHAGVMYSGNLKGLMGAASSETNRGMHSPSGDYTYDEEEYLAQCIADLNLVRKPDLCIIDALECGLNNGPAGPGETIKPNKIIAGKDPLATDVYAAKLMGFSTDDILTFKKAGEHGLGEIDPSKLKLTEL